MHDRRVDGKALTFGNQGALFMNAMTWWDWETFSIWSQPWGSAISGEMEGTALTLIPASIVPWATWLEEHPETTVLLNDVNRSFRSRPATPRDDFVIGVALGEAAKAYYYDVAADMRVINDHVGDRPVVVAVDPVTRDIKVYLRSVGVPGGEDPSEILFEARDGLVVDAATGSTWDAARGVAVEGPLKGTVLQQLPFVSSYDWAWEDFFPHTAFYEAP